MTAPLDEKGLLPCPLCGSAFKMGQEPHDNHPVGGMFYLYHDYGPLGSAARSCPLEINRHFDTAEAAATAWNTRSVEVALSAVALPDELEVVERLRNRAYAAEQECRTDDADLFSQAHSTIAALRAERDEAIRSRDHAVQWYAERLRKIEDVAKREGLWREVAAIIANGSGTRQLPDGSFVYDPPTYAQLLNSAKHRAATAEAEVKRLTEEKEALRVALDERERELREIRTAEGLLSSFTFKGKTYQRRVTMVRELNGETTRTIEVLSPSSQALSGSKE